MEMLIHSLTQNIIPMWRITIILTVLFSGLCGYNLHCITTGNATCTPSSVAMEYHLSNNNNIIYYKAGNDTEQDDVNPLDKWSIVWYIASFGGLIAFFLIVSCSEWCCRRNARNNVSANSAQVATAHVPETPPPSYDQFAPPTYDSLKDKDTEKGEYDVYVVPAHALGAILKSSTQDDASVQDDASPQDDDSPSSS